MEAIKSNAPYTNLIKNQSAQNLINLSYFNWTYILCSIAMCFHLKHNWKQDSPLTEFQEGDLYICLEYRRVIVHEQEIALTIKEFDILLLLIMNPNRVFTYEVIMDLVWNEDYTYYSRKAINNHVCNLRKKLKTEPGDPDYIKSVTGIGYKFALP